MGISNIAHTGTFVLRMTYINLTLNFDHHKMVLWPTEGSVQKLHNDINQLKKKLLLK